MDLKSEIEDMSYTYEGNFDDWLEGVKWANKKIVERVCEWLRDQKEMIGISFTEDFIERFKQDMLNDEDDAVDVYDTCPQFSCCLRNNYAKSHCWRRE